MNTEDDKPGPVFSAQDARQGEIILRTRTRRIVFIAGLVGIIVLAIVLRFCDRLASCAAAVPYLETGTFTKARR
ncbi:peptide ABC transporter permease [Mesorhizobium sp. B2-4-19]|uniref:peptide ABC transporter permease n=1 Tax=Mesorhizobium sp. B2-4-19 TaxID=2589930 RepID=UPI001FEF8727|nr:peptide ABC transporter permease [Mesorhizobium sp. B2-4-19]